MDKSSVGLIIVLLELNWKQNRKDAIEEDEIISYLL